VLRPFGLSCFISIFHLVYLGCFFLYAGNAGLSSIRPLQSVLLSLRIFSTYIRHTSYVWPPVCSLHI
jgi:hypothetical protein